MAPELVMEGGETTRLGKNWAITSLKSKVPVMKRMGDDAPTLRHLLERGLSERPKPTFMGIFLV